jgi:anti-anti-sigma regulatory factor
MDEQIRAMLQYAAGQQTPLRLSVRSPGSIAPTEVELNSPYAILGRGTGVDVPLDGDSVAFRHAYLQVIGNRVCIIDLFSLNGIRWDGKPAAPWLTPKRRFRIGDHWLQLQGDGWTDDGDLPSPLDFKPRDDQRPEFGVLPTVELQLVNTAAKGAVWPINRIITLVGRDERCRIKISDERISKVHCALLLLPTGLWVVDLLGKGGIKLNGYECRCGFVAQGCELQIGDYVVTARYPDAAALPPPPANNASGQGEFLTRINKVFKVEIYGDSVIVIPMGDVNDFSYRDVHLDAGRIIELLTQHGYRNVVIDMSVRPYVGSVIIDAMVNFCRSAKGRAAFCSVSPEMTATFGEMKLNTVWRMYESRVHALQAVYQA